MAYNATKWLCAVAALISAEATLAAGPQKKAGVPASGVLAKLPIKFGYYINDFESCSNPSYGLTKITPNGLWDIDPKNGRATETKLKSVSRDKDRPGWYYLNFPDAPRDEQDPGGIALRPKGPDRIEMGVQDTGIMRFCRPEELPARLRK